VFVEVSPHPVLVADVQETLADAGVARSSVVTSVVTGSLRRDEGDQQRFWTSLAELFVRGVEVDWTPAFAGLRPRRVPLPTYAFRHRRYWLDADVPATAVTGSAPSGGQHTAPDGEPHGSWRLRVAGLSAADRAAQVLELVRGEAAAVLGHGDVAAVVTDRTFLDLGLTSITAVELHDRLETAAGLDLPVTLVFDHPTPAAIARFVAELLVEEQARADGVAELPTAEASLAALERALTSASNGRAEILGRLRTLVDRWGAISPGSGGAGSDRSRRRA
jgi:acyl transferase domain-containing protein